MAKTNSDLVKTALEVTETGLTRKEATEFVEAYHEALRTAVAEGEEVYVHDLLKVAPKDRAERKGRNPQTGEELTIPAQTVVKVKPMGKLKNLFK